MSSGATMYSGIASRPNDAVVEARSTPVPCLYADHMPIGMAKVKARSCAYTISRNEIGKARPSCSRIGWLLWKVVPQSSVTRSFTQFAYCAGMLRSR